MNYNGQESNQKKLKVTKTKNWKVSVVQEEKIYRFIVQQLEYTYYWAVLRTGEMYVYIHRFLPQCKNSFNIF